ncbi:MAG: MlaD family protein [Candidatus Acidiferrales bacterium]|jgi:phospholipid/cholesterol/gamma-HCH transport system substrate-binding protein
MAQRKQLTWTELRVGLFVLVGLFILMVAIFYVTGAGFLGPKYRLVTYLPEVEGMKAGAPVDLDGLEIGNVQSMGLTPHPVDHAHNITLVLRVERKYQDQIRTDSIASLVTQGLLGDRYVTITRGLTGSVIPTNGVVPAAEQADIKQIVQRGADVAENLNALSEQLNEIVSKVRRGEGTIGKALIDPSLYNHLNSIASKADAMATTIQQGQGSIGKLVASDELYKKADSVVGKIDDAMTAVHDQKGTVGKLIYDPSAYDSVKSVAEKGDALLGDVRAGKGTLGKLATDDTAYNNLRDASANVRDATAKLNSNQGTAGKFFTDPAFYDNMTGLSGDLRLMIADFRQNPKKFLHIKLGLF